MQSILYRSDQARLVTRISADKAGLSDLVVKRDFRRELDQDIRREGYDYFWPNTTGDFASNPGSQPFPNAPTTSEPITLTHLARRPNGQHAIIAGTKTKLWRFFGMEDGAYTEGTGASAYAVDTPAGTGVPYFATNSSEWQLIGSGFSEEGHRWEALNINGYTVLNNGVDLPMTYRLEESEVSPIYELREQGIARVGTIGEINGILMCGDISEIQTEALEELMNPVGDIPGGNMTAVKTGSSVITAAEFFTAADVGRILVWEDTERGSETIQAVPSINPATGKSSVATVTAHINRTSGRFNLRNTATQAGATFSGLVTSSVGAASTTVTSSGAVFSVGMVGRTIRFSDGFSATITGYTSTTQVTINTGPAEAISNLPFWVTNAAAYNLVASADAFTAGMVGDYIIFDTGEVRQILAYVNAKNVTVDNDSAVSGLFRIENTESYQAFTDEALMDRIQYRTLWSMPDEPRRFGAIIPGSIDEDSQTVTLRFPGKSFATGQEIVIVGAGASGGNLTANILSVGGLGKSFLISATAETSVEDAIVEQSDAMGSIVGYEDLQDDSSAILRILKLGKRTLVIYKDTCIFLAAFTGLVDNPFNFDPISIPESLTLHYRWTLIDAGGLFHVYAGANSFYQFDLSSQMPRVIPQLDMISNKFFSEVGLGDSDEIFAADNSISNEVFIWFPSSGQDKGICFDYKQLSASTTSMAMTAAASVKRPVVGVSNGATEDIFLMGNSEGTMLVYGRSDETQPSWGDVKEIFYRRSAYPFSATKNGYESIMESGWGDFGQPHHPKDLLKYVLYLASQSENTGLAVTLYGTRNSSEPAVTLMNFYLPNPRAENMIATFFRQNYYKLKLMVSGKDNPLRILSHGYDVDLVTSGSHERRT